MARLMKMLTSLLIVCFIISSNTVCFAKSEGETKWDYVVTRNDVSYSVDMNSVKISGEVMIFWASEDRHKENKLGKISVAVNTAKREFRFEEGVLYNKETKEKIRSFKKPTEWAPIGKNSTIDMVVNYIFENHPTAKDISRESSKQN